jgi:tetratricopeptide (TPR) repeat protein
MIDKSIEKTFLHLPARSHGTQRIWYVGDLIESSDVKSSETYLNVCPDRHESFASFRSILNQLTPYAGTEQLVELAKIEAYLLEACPHLAGGSQDSHGSFMANSVTLAIIRRISRESAYTSVVIDLGAKIINKILSKLPNCKYVYVKDVDRLDRPTLKVLARAMLLLKPEDGFSWIWHSTSDPTATFTEDFDDLFISSRSFLLKQFVAILSPEIVYHCGVKPLKRPEVTSEQRSLYGISTALVLQNYDACFLWTDILLQSNDDLEVIEALRLKALAAINVGKRIEALALLHSAEEMVKSPGRRAHLCYLQGLIEGKRSYDLSASTAHYQRGLTILQDCFSPDEDLPLERGWLLNGLAMNEAIQWRRNSKEMIRHTKAVKLLREAFSSIYEDKTPNRAYLKYNLFANSTFLMEMLGKYDLAIDIFSKTFGYIAESATSQTNRADRQAVLNYRIGLLCYRAGHLDEADRLLGEVANQNTNPERWPDYERILRALGIIALEREDFSKALTFFSKGLEICRDSRSAEGTREHGRGLVATMLLEGKKQQAFDLYEMLHTEESLTLFPKEKLITDELNRDLRPSPPSPKLPAYIPEIDLEDIPTIDLNRFLGKTPSRDYSQPVLWRV